MGRASLLDLLETLVDWPSGAPILLVCPTRPELFDRHQDWCVGRPNATRVDLVALGSPDARALLEELPGGISLPSELADETLAAAEGNPLYIEEMLGMLIDDGRLQRLGTGWVYTAEERHVVVPPTIAALIAARLQRPGPARTDRDGASFGDRTGSSSEERLQRCPRTRSVRRSVAGLPRSPRSS